MSIPRRDETGPRIAQLISAIEPHLVVLRRDIHAHPETGFDTVRTAALVAGELKALGLRVQTGVGRTGVVAEIAGGAPGPCLILRADMDALPISERTGLAFASTVDGKMHACGHDTHTAALIGAATALRELAPRLKGSVRLIFQPAEETLESGAQAMAADGAADGASMAIALHNQPQLPTGNVLLLRGASTASSDEFKVIVRGISGHAARPHQTLDPIVGAASLISQLQTVISRNMDPAQSAVLTVGHITGGESQNIVPDSCTFEGTVRCRSEASRDVAEAAFRRICEHGAEALGLRAEVEYVRGVPAVQNDDRLIDQAAHSLGVQFGAPVTIEQGSDFGAEDFSYFSELMPSIQVYIGAGQPGRDDRLHNSDYQPDERFIGLAAVALTRMAVDLLN